MKQEYPAQPETVEVYRVGDKTDVILRKNIEEVKKSEEYDGKQYTYTMYECVEVQYRYPGILTKAEIEADFDYWWDWTPEAEGEATVTEEDRIAALEAAVLELAEVICNG